MGFEGQTVNI